MSNLIIIIFDERSTRIVDATKNVNGRDVSDISKLTMSFTISIACKEGARV